MIEKGTATSRHRPVDGPLKWHIDGGKAYLASKIVALMPKHLHYVEPYAGGLSVLLAKNPEGVSEVVNDINSSLAEFWGCLMNPELFGAFHRRVIAMPFSEDLWKNSEGGLSCDDGVRRAAAFFVRCRQSLAGRMDSFAPLSRTRVRRGMNEQASAWLNAIEGLPAVHERLKRVVILNRDALDVIRQQDGEQTLFYCDPPYVHSSRVTTGEYAHEMTDADHTALLTTLESINGKFLLSGYHSPLYDGFAATNKWRLVEFKIDNKASSKKEKEVKTECLWMNYDAPGSKHS